MPRLVQLNRNAKQYGILATGPVVKQEGTMPVRLVLRRATSGNYSTHEQQVCGKQDHLHHAFSSGHYFLPVHFGDREALKSAAEDFCRRLMEQLEGLPAAATVGG